MTDIDIIHETNESNDAENDALLPESEPSDSDVLDNVRHYQEIIEAILFAAGHPMPYSKIGDVLGLTDQTTKNIVEKYAALYNRTDEELPRGIMLLTYPTTCQLCTREEFGDYIREALGIRKGGNLSQSSIETLAIIAYNEPVTRTYIETIRGVDTTYTIGALVEKNLIMPCGRLDVPGRPLLYKTTPDFLRVFGLNSLSELPEVSALSFGKATEGIRVIEEVGEIIADADPSDENELPLFAPLA